MLRNRREQENGTRARCRRTSVAASTENEPAVSAKCLEHELRKIHGFLTTRVLDQGPTAAVAPDDLESRVYRECSPAAAGRSISEISERQTRAPDIRRGRAPPRTTRAPMRGEVHWHGRCKASSRNHPQ